MSNFSINFSIPWLLLLLVPALFLTLFPYFRLAKKYRRTRNRIISMVLHMVIMVLTVSVLAGITFKYDVPNESNEIVLLVDMSYSGDENQNTKNQFVQDVLEEGGENIKIGIVAFGYNQCEVLPIGKNNPKSAFDEYERFVRTGYNYKSQQIDNSATDIAAAIQYTEKLFSDPEVGKIVLVSDGVETDGDALNAVKAATSRGIKVDSVSYLNTPPDADNNREVEIVGVELPDYALRPGTPFSIEVTVNSSTTRGRAVITMTDFRNKEEVADPDDESAHVYASGYLDPLEEGLQTVTLEHVFTVGDLHTMKFDIAYEGDTEENNNSYYSFYQVNDEFNKVLLLEGYQSESQDMIELLGGEKGTFDITRICLSSVEDMAKLPKTLDELRAYHQVILFNVSNSDLTPNRDDFGAEPLIPEGYDKMLQQYVRDYGGGMLVIGGNDPFSSSAVPVPHAFNYEDFRQARSGKVEGEDKHTIFADMLPVDVTEYTPPVGVMIVIDCSSSMAMKEAGQEENKLDAAKRGAKACVELLEDTDYVGVITLSSSYSLAADMMPLTNRTLVNETIDKIQLSTAAGEGGTVFAASLDRASRALAGLSAVEVKEVIVVTDGEPNDDYNDYSPIIKSANEDHGITFSVIVIDKSAEAGGKVADIQRAVQELGGGDLYEANSKDLQTVINKMQEAIPAKQVQNAIVEDIVPSVRVHNSVVQGIEDEKSIPALGLFYGTRLKSGATAVLMAKHVPLYAQWKYGDGMVGAFTSSLMDDRYSDAFMTGGAAGSKIIENIIYSLMPTHDIAANKVTVNIEEHNYLNDINILVNREFDASQEVTEDTYRMVITNHNDDTWELPADLAYSVSEQNGKRNTINFTVSRFSAHLEVPLTAAGVYELVVEKVNVDEAGHVTGDPLFTTTFYKAFSYSAEYERFYDEEGAVALMAELATAGRGQSYTDPHGVFMALETELHREYDPMVAFLVTALVLFLLDVAVRKFKFKWIHEIIRDRKAKKQLLSNSR